MKSGWKNNNYQKMLVRMEQINKLGVNVGVVEPKMHTRPNRNPISMAQIYQWMEEGTRDGHVPKRPTLKPTFAQYRNLTGVMANNLMSSVVKGGNYKWPLHDVGGAYAKLVKNSIMKLQHPALRPITIRTRVNAGTTNPLVDTGQLHNSIGYLVR